MKKLLTVVAAVFALAANAEWKPVATVQLADGVSLAKGVAKLGEFTGNMMIGMMAAGALNDLPGAAAFGPGRKGAATLYVGFVENGVNEFGVLYPTAKGKEAFLKKYPDAVESNGLIRVTCPVTGKGKEVNYAAFSEDGKWVGFSDKPQQARVALEFIKTAEKPMDGDVAKLRILKLGLEEIAKDGEEARSEREKDVLGQIDGIIVGVRISDSGLDIRGAVKYAKDSELSRIGLETLEGMPLAFAGKSSVWVSAIARNCGEHRSIADAWKEIKGEIEKSGYKTDWAEFVQNGIDSTITIDLGKFAAYAKEQKDKKPGKCDIDVKESLKKMGSVDENTPFKAEGPAINFALALREFNGAYTPAERFAYTLPEISGKKLFAAGFFSAYSAVRAVLPVLAKSDPEKFAEIEPVLAVLPAEGKGGVAYAGWNEKESLRFFFRVGADEFKAVSAGLAAFSALSDNGVSDDDDPDDDLD